MEYRAIGGTGVKISHLCLGAPRTMDHLVDLLAGQEMVLDDATLDRIDELVAPGSNVNAGDGGWTSPSLEAGARRRW